MGETEAEVVRIGGSLPAFVLHIDSPLAVGFVAWPDGQPYLLDLFPRLLVELVVMLERFDAVGDQLPGDANISGSDRTFPFSLEVGQNVYLVGAFDGAGESGLLDELRLVCLHGCYLLCRQ